MEFFYELGLKGKGLESPQKNDYFMAEKKSKARKMTSDEGKPSPSPTRKEHHKEVFAGMSKADQVDKAIKERKAAGNFLTVVPNAETHQPMPKTLNLKLSENYNLRENTKNKEM